MSSALTDNEAVQQQWWIIRILPGQGVEDESLAAVLISADSLGWAWEGETVVAAFSDGEEDPLPLVKTACARAGVEILSMTSERAGDGDWVRRQREEAHPLAITPQITIVPTQVEYSPRRDEIILRMDAGMAFGTGEHATTRSCLILLERHLQRGQSLLDVGCGSGVLAMAAFKLGAGSVAGIDIDPDSVRVCAENAESNGVKGDWVCGDLSRLESLSGPYDFVTANIISWTLAVQLPFILRRLKPGGRIITSGILAVEREKMAELWKAHRLVVHDEILDGPWLSQLLVHSMETPS